MFETWTWKSQPILACGWCWLIPWPGLSFHVANRLVSEEKCPVETRSLDELTLGLDSNYVAINFDSGRMVKAKCPYTNPLESASASIPLIMGLPCRHTNTTDSSFESSGVLLPLCCCARGSEPWCIFLRKLTIWRLSVRCSPSISVTTSVRSTRLHQDLISFVQHHGRRNMTCICMRATWAGQCRAAGRAIQTPASSLLNPTTTNRALNIYNFPVLLQSLSHSPILTKSDLVIRSEVCSKELGSKRTISSGSKSAHSIHPRWCRVCWCQDFATQHKH